MGRKSPSPSTGGSIDTDELERQLGMLRIIKEHPENMKRIAELEATVAELKKVISEFDRRLKEKDSEIALLNEVSRLVGEDKLTLPQLRDLINSRARELLDSLQKKQGEKEKERKKIVTLGYILGKKPEQLHTAKS
jgi:uncharacterized coiled-coil protein SlyX